MIRFSSLNAALRILIKTGYTSLSTEQKSKITGRPWIYEYSDTPEGIEIFFPWKKKLDGSGPHLDIDLWKAVKASRKGGFGKSDLYCS
jgi:hypothetical protein